MPDQPSPLQATERQIRSHIYDMQSVITSALDDGNLYFFEQETPQYGYIVYHLQKNPNTEEAISDRGHKENVVLLAETSNKKVSVWFSIFESWEIARKRNRFVQCSFHFYLKFSNLEEEIGVKIFHQIFRLEWEDRCTHSIIGWLFPRQGAAYPHWQFDPWLTDLETRELLIKELQILPSGMVQEFNEALIEKEESIISSMPSMMIYNMKWFKKLHFPVIADWPIRRIVSFQDADLPHARSPHSLNELENWTYSSIVYLKKEFNDFLV